MTNRTAAVVATLLLTAAAPALVIAVPPPPSLPVIAAAAAAATAVPRAYLHAHRANQVDPRNPNCGYLVRSCPESPDAAAAPDSPPDSGVNAPPD